MKFSSIKTTLSKEILYLFTFFGKDFTSTKVQMIVFNHMEASHKCSLFRKRLCECFGTFVLLRTEKETAGIQHT